MPREKGIREMLENTQKFEILLHAFLDEDYGGSTPDRVAIPDEGSLVGDDGTFLLYRLSGSPLFEALRSAIASISEIANNLLANTPGKVAFDWIRRAFEWIDSMNAKVTTNGAGIDQLSLPGEDAAQLLRHADQLFLDVPGDVRKTLSDHKIHISTNKDGELTMKLRKGGAHHSLGSTCIRWCPFLYSALKLAIVQRREWEALVANLSREFLSIRSFAEGKPPNHPVVLQRSYGVREMLTRLLENCADLFVSPTTTLVDSCLMLLTNIDSYIRTYSNLDAAKEFATSRYSDDDVVTDNRHLLLDSLLERTILAGEEVSTDLDDTSKQGPFRGAARTLFVNAFQKAIITMDIDDSEECSTFCAVKAWEVENALFDLCQASLGESQISSEYREKARALRRSLEDAGNLDLCLRALSGDIAAEDLVRMTIDQLANPTVKKDREKATEVARQGLILTGSSAAHSANVVPSRKLPPTENGVKVRNAEAEAPISQTQSPRSAGATILTAAMIDQITSTLGQASPALSAAPTLQSVGTLRPTSKFGDLVKTARANTPPPPPPSLVMALKPVVREIATAPVTPSDAVTNASGGAHFYFSLAEGTRKFFATLHAERDPHGVANGLLPEELKQMGRLAADGFTDFLSSKMSGGRQAVLLRLATASDRDAAQHKKFYKEYEGKDKARIAMFKFGDGEKAFLVTPRFHRDAKGLTFAKATSTYLVLLSKKKK